MGSWRGYTNLLKGNFTLIFVAKEACLFWEFFNLTEPLFVFILKFNGTNFGRCRIQTNSGFTSFRVDLLTTAPKQRLFYGYRPNIHCRFHVRQHRFSEKEKSCAFTELASLSDINQFTNDLIQNSSLPKPSKNIFKINFFEWNETKKRKEDAYSLKCPPPHSCDQIWRNFTSFKGPWQFF